MWIKICGITSLEDAELAIAAGVDALGFVFAGSPRRVTPEQARDIIKELPASIEKIGVFVDTPLNEIARIYRSTGLTGIQPHGIVPPVSPMNMRAYIEATSMLLRVLQVVHFSGNNDRFALELRSFNGNPDMDAVLVDTCIAGRQGGTGQVFDWQAARDSFLREASHLHLIAAGGLNPENVGEAIATLEPWGVDVASGVEASPGRKDPEKVAAFIRAARRASGD